MSNAPMTDAELFNYLRAAHETIQEQRLAISNGPLRWERREIAAHLLECEFYAMLAWQGIGEINNWSVLESEVAK